MRKPRNRRIFACLFPPCTRAINPRMSGMPSLPALITALLLLATSGGTAEARPLAVTAAGHTDPEALAGVVHDFVHRQAATLPGQAMVNVDVSHLTGLPACHDLQTFLHGSRALRARMSVGVRCLAPAIWTVRVPVTLSVQGFFYTPNRDLEPGQTLTLDDLVTREGDILTLPRGVVSDPGLILDRIVTRRIPAGTTIKAAALRDPRSVVRGQTVRTQALGPGFVVSSEGRTLEDGAPGEQIRVRTPSGQVISATVLDAHTVQVIM